MKTWIILICLSFFCLLSSRGQIFSDIIKVNVDSLQLILPDLSGNEKIDALNRIAYASLNKYPDSCMALANRTIQMSEDVGYQKGMADGFFSLGNGYFLLDSVKQSVVNYLNAFRIYENISPCTEMALTCYALAVINWNAGRHEKAIEYAKMEGQAFLQLSKHSLYYSALFEVGAYFYGINALDSAEYYLHRSIELLKNHPDTNVILWNYRHLAYCMLKRANQSPIKKEYYKQCISYCTKILQLIELYELTEKYGENYKSGAYYTLARCYQKFDEEDSLIKAMEYINKAQAIAEKQNFLVRLMLCYNHRANLKFASGDITGAIPLYKKGISEAEYRIKEYTINDHYSTDPFDYKYYTKYSYKNSLQWPYNNLFHAYQETGDYKEALKYYTLWVETKEEIFQKDNSNLIAMLEADSENEKTEKHIAMLERDKQISELKVTQSRNFNIGVGILFMILILLGIVLFRQNKLKNEHKSTLLEQKLLRLQMNPHFIFNSLANIQDFIWNKDPLTANEYLSSFSKLVRLTLEHSRNDFVPVEKEISTIENYLNLQKLRHKDKFVYNIHVDPEIDEENMQIPPMLVQPFIENSIEHGIIAKDTLGHIDVKFTLNGDQIDVEVTDDGIGFKKSTTLKKDKKKEYQSLAMSITQERLLMHYRKYKRKIQLNVSDLKDANNNVMGAQVFLGIPYAEA